jgi:CRISPR-associated protein Csd1
MRAILEGLPYPTTLLQSVIRRIKAEHEITHIRAALIKACINRDCRFKKKTKQEELTVSLDPTNMNIGYRLGRLFAVLEKIQEEANPGINATIRDRYYAAASCSPVTVFSRLMVLKNHHLAKLDNPGRKINLEKVIGEIIGGIQEFPAHLNLEDQGRFAIGYYHQKQDFYTRKEKQD